MDKSERIYEMESASLEIFSTSVFLHVKNLKANIN